MIRAMRLAALWLMAGALLPASAEDSAVARIASSAAAPSLQAAFTPWDDIESLIVDALAAARSQIRVQAYLFSNKKIGAALIAAHRRGIDVQVLLDARQLEKTGSELAARLAAAGIPVWLDERYENAHNKVIVLDADTSGATVITGSYNFTWTAQHRNAENVLIVRDDPVLAARYAMNWERHRQEATPYKKP